MLKISSKLVLQLCLFGILIWPSFGHADSEMFAEELGILKEQARDFKLHLKEIDTLNAERKSGADAVRKLRRHEQRLAEKTRRQFVAERALRPVVDEDAEIAKLAAQADAEEAVKEKERRHYVQQRDKFAALLRTSGYNIDGSLEYNIENLSKPDSQ